MSKRIDTKNLKLCELKTVKTYIEWLKKNYSHTTTKQVIQYQLSNTDNLDYCDWQGNKLIIINEKAKTFHTR